MNSPFKFLDPYEIGDSKIFFGRDAEIDALYTLIYQTRLLLVYGQSGTGKTSVIQCGLANRFKPTDWFPVFVRRKDDLNASLDREIRRLAPTPIKDGASVVKATESLYLDHLKPIYFIFDQFEELFILGSADEQAAFFESVKALLSVDLNAKIIISMREEYIAMLQPFERVVPSLFAKRLRIEQMMPATIEAVIGGTVNFAGITLENGAATAQRIIEKLSDRRNGVQLAYLQVYLDTLYRAAAKTPTPMLFSDALVDATGGLGDVMADFLASQTAEIEAGLAAQYGPLATGSVQRILEEMTTVDGTKAPISRTDLKNRVPALSPLIDAVLKALDDRRIVRSADDVFELAHDSLGLRIAERRSTDRKALMRVEKLVQDRLAAFDQTRTWLSPEELAVTRPVLPALTLSPAQAAFVATSAARVRRKRQLTVGGTLAVIAVLIGFGTYAQISSQRAVDAIDTARSTINDLAFYITDRLAPIPNTEAIRIDLLGQAVAVDEKLAGGGGRANGSAAFWRTILKGDIAKNHPDMPGAEKQYRAAVHQAEIALVSNPRDRGWQRNLSVALGRSADIAKERDNLAAAVLLYARALRIDTAIAAGAAGDRGAQRDLAVSNLALGAFQRELGHPELARPYLVQAGAIAERLLAGDPDNADALADRAITLNNLGELERDEENFDAARAAYRKDVAIMERLVKADPERDDGYRNLVIGWYNLAAVSILEADWDEARAESDHALENALRLDADSRLDLEPALYRQRAQIERLGGETGHARRFAQKAVDLLGAGLLRTPGDEALRHDQSLGVRELSDIALAGCSLDEARTAARNSLAITRQLVLENAKDINYITNLYQIHERIGLIEHRAGAITEAQRSMHEAQRVARALKPLMPTARMLQDDIDRITRYIADLDQGLPAKRPANCPPGR